jgi:probable selenium-dependent hydroxylase accessory protein YqeC
VHQVTPDRLLDLLAARRGLVCVVGAGGKKSTLYRLLQAHAAVATPRVGLTSTVRTAPRPRGLADWDLIAEPEALAAELPDLAARHRSIAYAGPSTKPGRLSGVPPEAVANLHEQVGFSVTLVKADGARMRLIKAPTETEPVFPPGVATVLPVISIRALGRPLDVRVAHRPERVAAVSGCALDELLTTEHLARVLASEHGALQHIGAATVVPIINMVDDADRRTAAEATAKAALTMTDRFDRVILAAMTARDLGIAVITS